MRTVVGVAFSGDERRELDRAVRWAGIHPLADLPSTRAQKSKRGRYEGQTMRQYIRAVLNGLIEDPTPVFSERLDTGRSVLVELLSQAVKESALQYWTDKGTPVEYAEVLVESRRQAHRDIAASLAVLQAAAPFAQPARPEAEEEEDEDA